MDSTKVSSEEIDKIQKAIQTHDSLEFSCYSLTNEQKGKFTEILKVFLDSCDQSHLFNCLSYCLLELLDNANRANAKRIYFEDNNLDINNKDDYQKGMKDFKTIISDNSMHYLETVSNEKLKIDLQLSIDNIIRLQVTNNTKLTEFELQRINEKINKTKGKDYIGDVFTDVDQTEGSGLGIISIIFMLKRLGLETENLSFRSENDSTIAIIEIPTDSFMMLE